MGRRRSRLEAGQFVIEGPVLVREAIEAGVALEELYVDADALDRPALAPVLDEVRRSGMEPSTVRPGVLERISDTASSQGIVAVAGRRLAALVDLPVVGSPPPSALVVVLDAVADPGNAGTIVRSAEAAGASAVTFAGDGVDPLGPKTVRAAAGSIFRLPVAEVAEVGAGLGALAESGWRLLGAAAGGTSYEQVALGGPIAIVFGNESHGLSPAARAAVDEVISIPMRGRVESLNVAVASAVMCFEWARRGGATAGQSIGRSPGGTAG